MARVLKSALRRSISRNPVILTYWPLEDGPDSTSAASGLVNVSPMTVSGTPAFGAVDGPAGSDALLDLTDGGTLRGVGQVPSTTPDAMRLQLLVKFASGGSAATARTLMEWTTFGGTYTRWRLGIDASDELSIDYYSASVTENLVSIQGTFYDDDWHRIEVGQRRHQTTGDLITYLLVDSAAHAVGPFGSLGVGETFGYISSLTINPSNYSGTFMPAIGHVLVNVQDVFAEANPFAPDPGLDGYNGEMAHVRLARLCGEESVPFQTTAATSARMGPQRIDTLLALLRECEAADGGALYEKRWGLGYKSLNEYYNQPVSMSLDFDGSDIADLPEPADDDQRTRNVWTVRNVNGSEYTAEKTTGPMGTGPQGPGFYDAEVTLNLYSDADYGPAVLAELARDDLWRRLIGYAQAVMEGRAPPPPKDSRWTCARHESAHAVTALVVGATFDLVTIDPGRHGLTCGGAVVNMTTGRWPAAAVAWAGALAVGSAAYANSDLDQIAEAGFLRATDSGSPFAFAEDVVREHSDLIDAIADRLASSGTLTYDEVREMAALDIRPPDRTQRLAELMAEFSEIAAGRRSAPPHDDTARHEAGHALAAICLGTQFRRVTARPGGCGDCDGGDCSDFAGHICGLVSCGALVRAAHGWAGGLAEGTLVGAKHDLDAIHDDGLIGWAGPGSPFAVACAVVEEHADLLDVLAGELAAAGELSWTRCRQIVPLHEHHDWPDWA